MGIPKARTTPMMFTVSHEETVPVKRFFVDDGTGGTQVRLEVSGNVYLSDYDASSVPDGFKAITISYSLFKKHWRKIVEFYETGAFPEKGEKNQQK